MAGPRYQYTEDELLSSSFWESSGRGFISPHRRRAYIRRLNFAWGVYSTEHPGERLDWYTPGSWQRFDDVGATCARNGYLKEHPNAALYSIRFYSESDLWEFLAPVKGPCSFCGARNTAFNPTERFAKMVVIHHENTIMLCKGCQGVLNRLMRGYDELYESEKVEHQEMYWVALLERATSLALAIRTGKYAKSIASNRRAEAESIMRARAVKRKERGPSLTYHEHKAIMDGFRQQARQRRLANSRRTGMLTIQSADLKTIRKQSKRDIAKLARQINKAKPKIPKIETVKPCSRFIERTKLDQLQLRKQARLEWHKTRNIGAL